jgi:hypothetical protein
LSITKIIGVSEDMTVPTTFTTRSFGGAKKGGAQKSTSGGALSNDTMPSTSSSPSQAVLNYKPKKPATRKK